MHPLMLEEIVNVSRKRIAEGDSPTVKSFSIEQLEEAVVELADMVKRGRIARTSLPNSEWLQRTLADNRDAEIQAGPELA